MKYRNMQQAHSRVSIYSADEAKWQVDFQIAPQQYIVTHLLYKL